MTILVMLAIGAVAGILAGYLGIGGGIILVPTFQEYLRGQGVGIDKATTIAAATSLMTVFLTAGAVAIERLRRGQVLLKALPIVCTGAVLGSYTGAWIGSSLPGRTIRIIFAIFLLAVAAQLFFDKSGKSSTEERPLRFNIPLLATLGILTGIILALLGVGGGILMVPAFLLLFRFPWKTAAGTSSAIASITSLIGVISYISVAGDRLGTGSGPAWGVVDWKVALPVAAASLLTARWGTRLSDRFGGGIYRQAFALLLALITIRLFTS